MKAQRVRRYWAEAWQDPVSLLGPKRPRPQEAGSGAPALLSSLGGGPRADAGSAAGLSTGGRSSGHENQVGKTRSWPRLQPALRLAFSQAPLCPRNKDAERRWLLFQSWAS